MAFCKLKLNNIKCLNKPNPCVLKCGFIIIIFINSFIYRYTLNILLHDFDKLIFIRNSMPAYLII